MVLKVNFCIDGCTGGGSCCLEMLGGANIFDVSSICCTVGLSYACNAVSE